MSHINPIIAQIEELGQELGLAGENRVNGVLMADPRRTVEAMCDELGPLGADVLGYAFVDLSDAEFGRMVDDIKPALAEIRRMADRFESEHMRGHGLDGDEKLALLGVCQLMAVYWTLFEFYHSILVPLRSSRPDLARHFDDLLRDQVAFEDDDGRLDLLPPEEDE